MKLPLLRPTTMGRILVLGLAITSVACGNDDGGDPPAGGADASVTDGGGDGCASIQPTFTSIYDNILNTTQGSMSCATQFCHGSGASGGLNFTLDKGAVHTALLGPAAGGGGRNRVQPNDSANSWLHVKVTDPNAPGGRMPLGAPALPACQITAIQQWIDNGAQNN